MKCNVYQLFILIIFPLILGFSIYLFYRDDNIVMVKYLNFIPIVTFFRNYFSNFDTPLWVMYSLPDGLWCFAMLNSLLVVNKTENFLFVLLLITSCTIGSEVLQLLGVISGTFDFLDVLNYIIAIFFSYLIFFYKEVMSWIRKLLV